MIKLKNIKNENGIIKCDFIPEDSQSVGKFEFDCEKKQFRKIEMPKGYEWCLNHVEHAKIYLKELSDSKNAIPTEKTIMWY